MVVATLSLPDIGAEYTMQYEIAGTGDILLTNSFKPGDRPLPDMPRAGMQLKMPESFNQVTWFGRGPWENYIDRDYSASVGLYHSSVDSLNYAYIRPQETGYRTDVRWMAIRNNENAGLLVQGDPYFCFEANHFSRDDFDNGFEKDQKHSVDVKSHPWTALNLDEKQMGLGGDDSWGALPHPQYLIPVKAYAYTIRIRPYNTKEVSAEELVEEPGI